MTLAVFRKFSRTVPMPVAADPSTLAPPVIETPKPAAVPAPRFDRPPTYTPGLCWHKVHAYFDGVRYGVSPQRGTTPHWQHFQLATLTPCEHLSRTGT